MTTTDSIGGISLMVLAIIVVGGIIGVLSLIIIAAIIWDLPNRKKRKENTGILSVEEMELSEKCDIAVTVTRAPSISQSSSSQISYVSQTPSTSDRPGTSSTLAPPPTNLRST
ncbi:hypothetical protein yc1106_01152 [Curvularia clavata]|uniref:Uncharacterized protein n=1 Tax=Curvularia clavata TaxID=95742 RepID=A0A9Q8Z4N4_CURCL|nr:hypothetical protein yc1106_01152 [Curvularia clavata]